MIHTWKHEYMLFYSGSGYSVIGKLKSLLQYNINEGFLPCQNTNIRLQQEDLKTLLFDAVKMGIVREILFRKRWRRLVVQPC